MTDIGDDNTVRIVKLERRVRVLEAIVVAMAFGLSGFVYKQFSGSLPLRGSSLHIEAEGQPVLDVSRMVGSSVMLLWGEEQKNSVTLNAGAGGPSVNLSYAPDGGSAILSAGKNQGVVGVSTALFGRRFVMGVGGPDAAELFVVEGDGKAKRAPVMPDFDKTE